MSIILAIESSTDLASVALHLGVPDGAGTKAASQVLMRQAGGVQSHSQNLLPMVQALLAEAGIGLGQCNAIAFGAGPGSFTGVRTACGIAQGLAFGSGLPVIAVDTLVATAQCGRDATGASDVLVVLDARMGQVYWGQYRWLPAAAPDGHWQTITAARLDDPAAVTPLGNVLACGNGIVAYADILVPMMATARVPLLPRADLMPHAVQVSILAQFLFAAGKVVNAREAQPVYLRNDVALTTLERQIKRAEAVA